MMWGHGDDESADEAVLCQRCGVQTRESRVDAAGYCYGCGGAVPQAPEAPGHTPGAPPGRTLAAVFCPGFLARSGLETGCSRCSRPYADHTLGEPRTWEVHIPGDWTHRDLAKFRRGLGRLLARYPGAQVPGKVNP